MKLKALIVCSLFIAALFLPFDRVQAGDGYEKYIEWYSDASKTDVVGWRHQKCDGVWESDGYQTSYRQQWLMEECVEDWGGGGYYVCNLSGSTYTNCPAQCSICVYQ